MDALTVNHQVGQLLRQFGLGLLQNGGMKGTMRAEPGRRRFASSCSVFAYLEKLNFSTGENVDVLLGIFNQLNTMFYLELRRFKCLDVGLKGPLKMNERPLIGV